ncbi:MAG: hypothetical protein ACRDKB_10165, partial [Actinomycetota bacterium]
MTSGMILAHGVGRVYELPLPLSLYLGGAGATVLVSFLIRALAPGERPLARPRRLLGAGGARILARVLRIGGAVALVLALGAGALNDEGGLTTAPLLLWVGLVVGMIVLSSVIGGAWRAADPWAGLERLYRAPEQDPVATSAPPWWLGPASLYALFWFELVSGVGFDGFWVLVALLVYSLYALSFRERWGEKWADADPLSILFGFASRAAPLRLRSDGIFYVGPLAGLDERRAMPLTLFASLFVILASTTLDNVRETVGWTSFKSSVGLEAVPSMIVDSAALALFTLLFFLPLLLAVAIARTWLGRDRSVIEVSRRFGWSLIPIAIAYVLAHNAPLLIIGIPQLVRELSDPFALG